MTVEVEVLQNRYDNLKQFIAERQHFEKQSENQKVPYINHPTTLNFSDIHGPINQPGPPC